MTYKPIDDGYDFLIDGNPFPSIMGDICFENTDATVLARQRKSAVVYHPGPTDQSNISNVDDSAHVVGYPMESFFASSSPAANRALVGLQFSTHPCCPMMVPIAWTPGIGTTHVKIRVAAEIRDASVDMIGYYRFGGAWTPTPPTYYPPEDGDGNPTITNLIGEVVDNDGDVLIRGDNYPDTATYGVFSSDTKDGDNYVEMVPTTTTGTEGISYYEITVPVRGDLPTRQDHLSPGSYLTGYIWLGFCSRIGGTDATPSAPSIEQVDTAGHVWRSSLTEAAFISWGAATHWGKLHKVALVTQATAISDGGADGAILSYHHVLQTRRFDSAEIQDPVVDFVLHPRVPLSENETKNVVFYDLGNVVLHSITLENVNA